MFAGKHIGQRWWRAATVVTMTGALMLSGCAKNDSGSATSAGPTNSTVAVTPQKVDDLAATVPDDIRKSGKLVVGVTIPYTPNEFRDAQGKIVGFDVDLMNAVAGVLGLTTDYRDVVVVLSLSLQLSHLVVVSLQPTDSLCSLRVCDHLRRHFPLGLQVVGVDVERLA